MYRCKTASLYFELSICYFVKFLSVVTMGESSGHARCANCGRTFASVKGLRIHRTKVHPRSDANDTSTRVLPTLPTDVPEASASVLQGMGYSPDLVDCLLQHYDAIRSRHLWFHKTGAGLFQKRLVLDGYSTEEVRQYVRLVHRHISDRGVYKIQIGLTYLLQQKVTNEIRCFQAQRSGLSTLFPRPKAVASGEDLELLLSSVHVNDAVEQFLTLRYSCHNFSILQSLSSVQLIQFRPDTSWFLRNIVSVTCYIYGGVRAPLIGMRNNSVPILHGQCGVDEPDGEREQLCVDENVSDCCDESIDGPNEKRAKVEPVEGDDDDGNSSEEEEEAEVDWSHDPVVAEWVEEMKRDTRPVRPNARRRGMYPTIVSVRDDNCVFVAIACFKRIQVSGQNFPRKGVRREADQLVASFFHAYPRPKKLGYLVTRGDVGSLEKHFELNINLYQLREKPTKSGKRMTRLVMPLRLSSLGYSTTLNLDITDGAFHSHCRGIYDMQRYCNRWKCNSCGTINTRYTRHEAHVKRSNCVAPPERVLRGVSATRRVSVFDQLREHFTIRFNPDQLYVTHFTTFDIETIQTRVPREMESKGNKLTIHCLHEIVSFAIHSNVPMYTDVYYESRQDRKSPRRLIGLLIDRLLQIAAEYRRLQMHKYESVFTQIVNQKETLMREAKNSVEGSTLCKLYTQKKNELDKLERELHETVMGHYCLGWSLLRYDVAAMKPIFLSDLASKDGPIGQLLKRGTEFLSIRSQHLVFRDALSTCGGNCMTLSSFLRAHDCNVQKMIFPYDFATSLEVLDSDDFPDKVCFYNRLKACPVDDREYDNAKDIFDRQCKNKGGMWLYLKLYNSCDVVGLTEGIDKVIDFWRRYTICMLTEGVSLPGLSYQLLLQTARKGSFLWAPTKYCKWIAEDIEKNQLGGLSIAVTRLAAKGLTNIEGKPVETIQGYDSSALYLSKICGDMPCGIGQMYTRHGDVYLGQFLVPTGSSRGELELAIYLEHVLGDHSLRHVFREGQVRISKRRITIDITDITANVAYFYNGQRFHMSHDCDECLEKRKHIPDNVVKAKRDEDAEKYSFLHKIGYKVVVVEGMCYLRMCTFT